VLLLAAMNAHSASDRVLSDFSTATHLAGWQIVNDDVMGGVSTSRLELTNGVAVFRGELSLEHNGGFASVRSAPAHHDLEGCDALVIRVRGDGRRYKFTARVDQSFDRVLYQTTFVIKKDEWQEHRFPLRDFVASFRGRVLSDEPPLDPARVTSVGFLISDRQEGPFRLETAWIKGVGAAATARSAE
jgi:monofunctional biosynthetic peptidoglycan transglycosylase